MISLHFRIYYSLFLRIEGDFGAKAAVNLLTVPLSLNLFAIAEILLYPIFKSQAINVLLHVAIVLIIAFLVNQIATRKFITGKAFEKIIIKNPSINVFIGIIYFLFSCIFFPLVLESLYGS
jgi:hypothetical protein